jgi:hypothetical protein
MPEFGNKSRLCFSAAGLLLGGGPLLALDADQVLNFTWDKLTVKPQLSWTGTYTDNLFYGNNHVLQTGYLQYLTNTPSGTVFGPTNAVSSVIRAQQPDYLFYFSPGAKLSYGYSDANQISFEYGHDEILHADHPQYDTEQNNLALKSSLQTGHLLIKGADRLQFLSSFLGGGTGIGATYLQQVNRIAWTDDYSINYDFSPKTYFYTSGSHWNTTYDKGTGLYSSDTLSSTVGAGYNFSPLVSVFTEGHYGQSAIGPNVSTQAKGPHSDFLGGSVGVKGDFTARLTGSVKVGYETRSFPPGSGAAVQSKSTPTVEVGLTYVPSLKNQLALNYSRRTDISQQFGSQIITTDTISLTALQYIGGSSKWFVQGRINYVSIDYSNLYAVIPVLATDSAGNVLLSTTQLGFTADPNVFSRGAAYNYQSANLGRTDEVYGLSATLFYQPRPWLQLSLAYEYDRYSPQFRSADYAALHPLIPYAVNQITLRAAIGF